MNLELVKIPHRQGVKPFGSDHTGYSFTWLAASVVARSADAAERLATAQEARNVLLQEAAEEEEERSRWRLDRAGKSMDFRPTDRTSTRRYAVVVTGEPTLFVSVRTADLSATANRHPTPDHKGDAWTQRIGLPELPPAARPRRRAASGPPWPASAAVAS